MKLLFSIVVLTFNEEKNIGILLNKLKKLINYKYKFEIIIIDSESTDKTLTIIKQKQKILKNLRLFYIKKGDFNFGTTRNLAVKLAQGEYILFISADAVPISDNFLGFFFDDFKINNKVVAVFGKQIPFYNSSFISQLEITHLYNKLQKYTNKDEIFIQSKTHFLYNKEKEYLYFISNVFSCYRRDFLLNNPFKKVIGCEDLMMGKDIIENGFIKIFDSRCIVKHSHNFNLFQYYKQQKLEFLIKINNNYGKKIRLSNIYEKIKMIIKSKQNISLKFYFLLYFIIYSLVKLIAYTEIKILKLLKKIKKT